MTMWKTSDGRVFELEEMSVPHMFNTARKLFATLHPDAGVESKSLETRFSNQELEEHLDEFLNELDNYVDELTDEQYKQYLLMTYQCCGQQQEDDDLFNQLLA